MSSLEQPTTGTCLRWRSRCSAVFVGLAAVLVAAAGSAHGQLTNPGFEESGGSLAGWQVFGNWSGNVTVASTTPHSGSWVASVSGPSSSGPGSEYSGFVQGVPTNPGAYCSASAYVRHNTGSLLEGDNRLCDQTGQHSPEGHGYQNVAGGLRIGQPSGIGSADQVFADGLVAGAKDFTKISGLKNNK